MPINPDQVRVDLLRIKRKLYISYPEGSKERQEFLLASKLSELSHLQRMIAPDIVDMVFEEYRKIQRAEVINTVTCLLSGACLSLLMLEFYQLHPHTTWLLAFPLPGFMGLCFAFSHVFHAINHWKSLKPFKEEYEKISKKVERLLKEISEMAKKK